MKIVTGHSINFRTFCIAQSSLLRLPLSRGTWIQFTTSHNILISTLISSSDVYVYLQDLRMNEHCTHSSYSKRAVCPIHYPPWFDLTNNIWWRVQTAQQFIQPLATPTESSVILLRANWLNLRFVLGAFAWLRKAPVSFVMSVRLSACISAAPTGQI
jgi:hypothetical protein